MLCLTRKKDEVITIGDDIEVMVIEIRGNKVRLGINADRNISVHRKEIYDAIKREEILDKTRRATTGSESDSIGNEGIVSRV